MTVTKFETANFFVTSFFDPVFDAESHGGLNFGSFCCFEVDIFGKSMVLRAHPVGFTHTLPRLGSLHGRYVSIVSRTGLDTALYPLYPDLSNLPV